MKKVKSFLRAFLLILVCGFLWDTALTAVALLRRDDKVEVCVMIHYRKAWALFPGSTLVCPFVKYEVANGKN